MAANTQTGDKQLKLKAKDFMLVSNLIDSLLGNIPRTTAEEVTLDVLRALKKKILHKCLDYVDAPNSLVKMKIKSYESLALKHMVTKTQWIAFDSYIKGLISRLNIKFKWIDNNE